MKQFSLEEYLKNPSRKVVTRDGRNVRIICTDRRGDQHSIVALVESPSNNEEAIFVFQKNGCYDSSCGESTNDLFFAPEKREGWMSVTYDWIYDNQYFGNIHDSEDEAKDAAKRNADDIILKLEWEE